MYVVNLNVCNHTCSCLQREICSHIDELLAKIRLHPELLGLIFIHRPHFSSRITIRFPLKRPPIIATYEVEWLLV